MGAYSSTQILASIQSGSLVCIPFASHQAQDDALLLTLGSYYYRTRQDYPAAVHNPLDVNNLEQYFEGPFRALEHQSQCIQAGIRPMSGLSEQHPVILLRPNDRLVAHSHEFVSLPADHVAELHELPQWRQSGILIHRNFAHVSSVTRLSITIHNTNSQQSVLLPVGTPIAQLVVIGTPTEASPPSDGNAVDAAIATWTPGSMLAQPWPTPIRPPANIQGLHYA
ncbi:MAG TPA: hypothetical protein VLE99_01920 [Candidatus Saccharimonadales bacterium]|nr:hypothetical protein [Candidatus Saccharimonadales bacterium]